MVDPHRVSRRRFLATGLAAGGALLLRAPAAAMPVPKERLRALIHLPRFAFRIGLSYDPLLGFLVLTNASNLESPLAALRKAMVGSAADADLHRRIAGLYAAAGNARAAQESLQRAVGLYRQQNADQSSDPGLAAGYALALAADGQLDEAERVLRRTVSLPREDGHAASAFARVLLAQAVKRLTPSPLWSARVPLVTALLSSPNEVEPVIDGLDQARRLLGEAGDAADRAVVLEPEEVESHHSRALVLAYRSLLAYVSETAGESLDDRQRTDSALFPAAASADLQLAATCRGSSAEAIGIAALYHLNVAMVANGQAVSGASILASSWDSLPDGLQRATGGWFSRLETLSEQGSGETQASALDVLGLLQFVVRGDRRGAEASLRRALTLDPHCERAWENLACLLALERRFEPLRRCCEERLAQQDTAQTWLFLARSFERLRREDDTLETLETANRRHPDEVSLKLALAATLLKSGREDNLLRAARFIDSAAQKLGDHKGVPSEVLLNLLFVRGVFFGLVDELEPARANLNQLLEFDKDNEEAREALHVLEDSDASGADHA